MARAKVENYLLRPETVAFTKGYKKELAGMKFLQKQVIQKVVELKGLQQVMNKQKENLMSMLQQQPRELSTDLAHQPMEDEQ